MELVQLSDELNKSFSEKREKIRIFVGLHKSLIFLFSSFSVEAFRFLRGTFPKPWKKAATWASLTSKVIS